MIAAKQLISEYEYEYEFKWATFKNCVKIISSGDAYRFAFVMFC